MAVSAIDKSSDADKCSNAGKCCNTGKNAVTLPSLKLQKWFLPF